MQQHFVHQLSLAEITYAGSVPHDPIMPIRPWFTKSGFGERKAEMFRAPLLLPLPSPSGTSSEWVVKSVECTAWYPSPKAGKADRCLHTCYVSATFSSFQAPIAY